MLFTRLPIINHFRAFFTPLILLFLSLCVCPFALAEDSRERQIQQAIEKGVTFLVENQNPDGSWGGVRKTKGLNIFAPIPGAHDAFKMASSSLALSGLCAHEDSCSQATTAIIKGEQWLLNNHQKVKRATGDALYNIWAHAYGLRAFTDLSKRASNNVPYLKAAQWEYNQLLKFEVLGGGWSYYNFGANYGGLYTQKPSGSNFSFVTSTVLTAILYCQKGLPLEVNKKRLNRTYRSLLRQRLPDGSYLYGEYLRTKPRFSGNRPAGSLARTPAALTSLLIRDPKAVPEDEVEEWVNRFITRHGFLSNAKKRPVPHESPFAISGYYYYYGHYYISQLCHFLPIQKQPQYRKPLIDILLKAQEKNGSWWDYPLYDYHETYGTGYVLKALANYQSRTQSP